MMASGAEMGVVWEKPITAIGSATVEKAVKTRWTVVGQIFNFIEIQFNQTSCNNYKQNVLHCQSQWVIFPQGRRCAAWGSRSRVSYYTSWGWNGVLTISTCVTATMTATTTRGAPTKCFAWTSFNRAVSTMRSVNSDVSTEIPDNRAVSTQGSDNRRLISLYQLQMVVHICQWLMGICISYKWLYMSVIQRFVSLPASWRL